MARGKAIVGGRGRPLLEQAMETFARYACNKQEVSKAYNTEWYRRYREARKDWRARHVEATKRWQQKKKAAAQDQAQHES